MVPQEGGGSLYRHIKCWHQPGRHHAPACNPLGGGALWMAGCIPFYRYCQCHTDFFMGQYVSQAARAPAAFRRRTPLYPKRSNRTNDKDPLAPPAAPSSDLGFSHWKIPDRSHLVVFSFLAGEIFVYRI